MTTPIAGASTSGVMIDHGPAGVLLGLDCCHRLTAGMGRQNNAIHYVVRGMACTLLMRTIGGKAET
jgi:hypothetical protein